MSPRTLGIDVANEVVGGKGSGVELGLGLGVKTGVCVASPCDGVKDPDMTLDMTWFCKQTFVLRMVLGFLLTLRFSSPQAHRGG